MRPSLLAGLFALVSPLAVAEPLAAHRATYDLSLDASVPSGGLEGARGRIALEMTGNACEGYTSNFRQVAELAGSGGTLMLDTRQSNHEDVKAGTYRFSSETYRANAKVEDVEGLARRQNGALEVTLKAPEPRNLSFTGTPLFPNEHLVRIIASARAGANMLEAPVFDGGEKGEKVLRSLAIIGKPLAAGQGGPDAVADADPKLQGLPRWRINISYSDMAAEAERPLYTMGFDLYANGVARALLINYGEFALKGTLSTLEWLPQQPCD